MNELVTVAADSLPILLDRAATALAGAKSSAEVLEARDLAHVAYDAAKSAGRMARNKKAYDDVIGAVYRAQADALMIEARAKMRLADEYDAAQERGEVAGHGRSNVEVHNVTTAADLGLRRDEIHEARKLRDAEAASPGKTAKVLSDLVARGEEPTKAALRREMVNEAPTEEPADAKARRALAKLTREALEDDVLGLRADLADAKAKLRELKAESADLKGRLRDLESTDHGEVIRRLQAEVRSAGSEKWRQTELHGEAMKQVYALKMRVAELEAADANQMIPLN